MDQLVDEAGRPSPGSNHDRSKVSRSFDLGWEEDIEPELYRSVRETGWGCAGIVALGPAPEDSGE
jgi:hypothetical protein